MGQDAVALVRIPDLEAPKSSGVKVLPLEDCALVFTFDRFAGFTADEHALRLRETLGKRLDPHDDDRGILFFSDISEPEGLTYRAIVREVGRAGRWGNAERLTAKRSSKVDRFLRAVAAKQGLDHEWFEERLKKKSMPSDLRDFIAEVVDAFVVDSSRDVDEFELRPLVGERIRAIARGDLKLSPPRKKKEQKLTKPGEAGYDADVEEMVRMFGGDEASWREALAPTKRG